MLNRLGGPWKRCYYKVLVTQYHRTLFLYEYQPAPGAPGCAGVGGRAAGPTLAQGPAGPASHPPRPKAGTSHSGPWPSGGVGGSQESRRDTTGARRGSGLVGSRVGPEGPAERGCAGLLGWQGRFSGWRHQAHDAAAVTTLPRGSCVPRESYGSLGGSWVRDWVLGAGPTSAHTPPQGV